MSKDTPEWEWERNAFHEEEHAGVRVVPMWTLKGPLVLCRVWEGAGDRGLDERTKRHMALIKAAPEMLAALKEARTAISHASPPPGTRLAWAAESVSAAIAKAEEGT